MSRKVLIVDDEPLIRDMIRVLICEGETGYEVVGEAINGALALDYLADNPVDIVVTDIRMPVMDGIGLIREAHERGLSAGIIVLSAYDEFHLVKEAFKLGVRDYLLKSEITREELIGVLRRVSASTDCRERLLSDALEGKASIGCEELVDWGLGNRVPDIGYRVLFIRLFRDSVGNPVSGASCTVLSNTRSGTEKQVNPLSEWLRLSVSHLDGGNIASTLWSDDALVVLVSGCRPEALFMALAEHARAEGHEIIGGISDPSTQAALLPELFRQATAAASYYFFRGRGRLVSWASVAGSEKECASSDYTEKLESLRKLVSLRNTVSLAESEGFFLAHPPRMVPREMVAVKRLFFGYYELLRNAIVEEPEESCVPIKTFLQDFDTRLRVYGTLEEYNVWIRDVLREFCSIINSRSRLVRKVLEYIANTYSGNPSLSEIARQLEVSGSYLSRLFSQEMRCGFVSYLAKVRIEKALELLATTELKIYEIAEKTGYRNTEHFNRTFKKLLGHCPRDYR